MSAIEQKEFDRHLRPRERHFSLARIGLRQRSADHPMIMFFMIVATAFTAMALVPPSGSAFASMGVSTAAVAGPSVKAKASATAVAFSDIDIACSGQAWGAENADCLAMIARGSGRSDFRTVRLIADVETKVPHVF
jgi:hypothetical protein